MRKTFTALINRARNLVPLRRLRASRRRFHRRTQDPCVSLIDGAAYPVKDWSMGGVLVFADTKNFSINQKHRILLKFRLRARILEVPITGSVVRKTAHSIALQFDPLTFETNRQFRSVLAQL